jgi:hypothetical protein
MGTNTRVLVSLLSAITLVSACASTPRPYGADIIPPPADRTAFQKSFNFCSEAVSNGRTQNFRGDEGAAGTGLLVAGTGAAVVAGGAAVAGSTTMAATYGAAGAAAGGAAIAVAGAALVIVAPLVMMNMADQARDKKEKTIMAGMDVCLREEGYVVQNWRQLTSEEQKTALSTPIKSAPPPKTK